jgi:hypothetical protein
MAGGLEPATPTLIPRQSHAAGIHNEIETGKASRMKPETNAEFSQDLEGSRVSGYLLPGLSSFTERVCSGFGPLLTVGNTPAG